MRQTVVLLAAIAMMIAASPAGATMRLAADRGGLIIAYAERFEQARASGEQVVIDGACLSACTLVVGMLPHGKVCATPRAVLGFHAAWRPGSDGSKATSPVATQAMMDIYPANLREWISQRGGLTPNMIYLRGRELTAFVPPCSATASLGARHVRGPSMVRSAPPHATFAAQQLR
jgi:hypothetical protein